MEWQEFNDLVRSVRFKNWEITPVDCSGACGIRVVCKVQDSTRDDPMLITVCSMILLLFASSREAVIQCVWETITATLLHEAGEWFKVGEEYPKWPHKEAVPV